MRPSSRGAEALKARLLVETASATRLMRTERVGDVGTQRKSGLRLQAKYHSDILPSEDIGRN